MGAMPDYVYQTIDKQIDEVAAKMRALTPMPEITHDDFLSLFVPAEEHCILKDAARIAYASSTRTTRSAIHHKLFEAQFDLDSVSIDFVLHGDDAPLIPRNHHQLRDAPQHVLDAVAEWACSIAETNIQAQRASKLLYWFNYNLTNPGQLRFLWPSVVTLASKHPGTKGFADKIRDLSAPKTLPNIPQEIKNACKLTAGFIASASLISDEDDTPDVFRSVTLALPPHYNGHVTITKDEGALGTLIGNP